MSAVSLIVEFVPCVRGKNKGRVLADGDTGLPNSKAVRMLSCKDKILCELAKVAEALDYMGHACQSQHFWHRML